MKRYIAAIFALAACAACAEKFPFDRYEGVVERYPFGRPPPNFNPNRMASEVSKSGGGGADGELTPEQEALTKAVGFSVINLEANGDLMVGFTDLSVPSSPKHYYMRVGETRNGWFVKEADQGEKTMTVEKDGVEVSLCLGSNSKDAPAAASGAKAPQDASAAGRRAPQLLGATPGMTFRERRREREAEKEAWKRREEESKREREAEKEAREKREEEERLQREAERQERREQLMLIRDELRRAREENAAAVQQEIENAKETGDEENDS